MHAYQLVGFLLFVAIIIDSSVYMYIGFLTIAAVLMALSETVLVCCLVTLFSASGVNDVTVHVRF